MGVKCLFKFTATLEYNKHHYRQNLFLRHHNLLNIPRSTYCDIRYETIFDIFVVLKSINVSRRKAFQNSTQRWQKVAFALGTYKFTE